MQAKVKATAIAMSLRLRLMTDIFVTLPDIFGGRIRPRRGRWRNQDHRASNRHENDCRRWHVVHDIYQHAVLHLLHQWTAV
jgi:hypothetical protein